jgi:hypothetical protein
MKWVLLIREVAGSWAGRPPHVEIHPTEESAEKALVAFVSRNWSSELPDSELPEDESEMVRQYFEDVPEAYHIGTAEEVS